MSHDRVLYIQLDTHTHRVVTSCPKQKPLPRGEDPERKKKKQNPKKTEHMTVTPHAAAAAAAFALRTFEGTVS